MKMVHARLPKHRPSTMSFLKKSFGVKLKPVAGIKSAGKKTATRRGRP
jgi:hypothetical protein